MNSGGGSGLVGSEGSQTIVQDSLRVDGSEGTLGDSQDSQVIAWTTVNSFWVH